MKYLFWATALAFVTGCSSEETEKFEIQGRCDACWMYSYNSTEGSFSDSTFSGTYHVEFETGAIGVIESSVRAINGCSYISLSVINNGSVLFKDSINNPAIGERLHFSYEYPDL